MRLHEFMGHHRDEILAACQLERAGGDHAEAQPQHFEEFFDELLRAVRRDSEVHHGSLPLPNDIEAVARFGAALQRVGLPVARLPRLFHALAQALDTTGQRYDLLRMEALLGQCLGVAQLEVGVVPEFEPIHLASLLRGLQAAAMLDGNTIIQLEVVEQLFIAGDELWLNSALSNLLHNAIRFSPSGSTIRLGVHAANGMALVQVEDQCGGLKHESPAQLLKPYVKQREGNQQWVGLGLTIVKRAVEAMKGELSVANLPGEGCVFSARFPLLTR